MKKTVLVGVTSSIAAFKSVQLVSDLLKLDYDVDVVMSKNATEFIQPLTFSSLTHRKVYVDTFSRSDEYVIEHIDIAKRADVILIAPATANVIAKLAHGIADDMLTTIFLAATCPKLVAPAMNTNMLLNPITQDNMQRLRDYGIHTIDAQSGLLACGDNGSGKLASIEMLIDSIEAALHTDKPLKGKRVLVSAGPTQEALDPVRFISNHSSGKMGYAMAKAARNLGADVTLVSGPTSIPYPFSINVIPVISAEDMASAMKTHAASHDYIVMAAAVADFKPETAASQKIKKKRDSLSLNMVKTEDILYELGKSKQAHQKIIGFAMETEHVLENAQKKFLDKQCDLLVVNDLNEAGAGFKNDTNRVSLVQANGITDLALMSKEDVAYAVFKTLLGENV